MLRHLATCAYPDGNDGAAVIQIRVDVPGTPFWIDLDVESHATLRQLDRFLRDIWLECCGHLSSFEVGPTRYVIAVDGESFDGGPRERSMNAHISAALPPQGGTFSHEYDFGSATRLRLKVVAHRRAADRPDEVRLLARNDAPVWTCDLCDEPATSVCAFCMDEDAVFSCEAHVEEHECGDEGMLPVVNSPRMGVCGYTDGA